MSSAVSHVELVHLCSGASSFVPCFRVGEETGVPRVGGREVYKEVLWQRELIQWLELALFLPSCTEQGSSISMDAQIW